METYRWLLSFLLVVSAATGNAQSRRGHPSVVDWSNPEKIDPLRPGIFDFLDADLSEHGRRAHRAYSRGEFEKAAAEYLFLLHHEYTDASAMYNLACCYGRLGRAESAARLLLRAVRAGYRNVRRIREDADFDPVRDDRVFSGTVAQIETWLEGLGSTVLVRGEKVAPCRIREPADYDGKRPCPLVVGLHGNGGCPEDFVRLYDEIPDPGFILAVPQGMYEVAGPTGSRQKHFSWVVPYRDEALWEWADPLTVAYIVNVVEGVSVRYNIDRVYVMGFSQGASYAYVTGILHPEIFHGMVAVSGILPRMDTSYAMLSDSAMEAASRLPVLIAHSREDEMLEYEQGIWARQRLEKLGYDVTFIDYPGGHSIPSFLVQEIAAWISRR